MGINSAACRAYLGQGVFQLVFRCALRQIIGNCISTILASAVPRLASASSSKASSSCSFVDIAAQIEAVATVPDVSGVTHGDVVFFLTETIAVLAETFGVRSLAFA